MMGFFLHINELPLFGSSNVILVRTLFHKTSQLYPHSCDISEKKMFSQTKMPPEQKNEIMNSPNSGFVVPESVISSMTCSPEPITNI